MTPLTAKKVAPGTDRENITVIVDALRLLVQTLRTSGREAEQELGISSAQLYILQELADQPAQSINQLAERTYTHQSSVSMVVQKLVDSRLVTRTSAKGDARKLSISLAAGGRAMLKKSPKSGQSRLMNALRDMPRSERNDLAHSLASLVKTLEGESIESKGQVPLRA